MRKAVGLPVTKQLIYYKEKLRADSMINVSEYQLIEMFEITNRWYTVEITLEDGMKARIHSSHFAEMQTPSFIADMKKQMV